MASIPACERHITACEVAPEVTEHHPMQTIYYGLAGHIERF